MSDSDVVVRDSPERGRYEASVDGALAGRLEYSRTDGRVVLVHAEVDPAYEGRGVASALARTALDEAVSGGLTVVPECPFVVSYLRRHPEYLPSVDEAHRRRLA
jgi:predicted GNAT family acetyltransferase